MSLRRVPVPAGPPPSELVATAVAAIRAGKLVALPTETVYGLAAIPGDPAGVERIRALKQRDERVEFTHHIADREAVARLVAPPNARMQRLLDAFWPGPLTVVLPGRDGSTLGLRLPDQSFTRAVIRETGPSLFLTSVNRSGEPPLTDPAVIAKAYHERLDFLFDAGPSPLELASSVVRWTPGEELEVLREGALPRAILLREAARLILFVCSGNTCRSPMAEALARRAAARILGTNDDRVLAHGWWFASAGTGAVSGAPASANAVAVLHDLDIDLSGHRSTALDVELLHRAERIFCMNPNHLVSIWTLAPDLAERVELLDPGGASIHDPFGGNFEAYRSVRDAIRRAVGLRVDALLSPR